MAQIDAVIRMSTPDCNLRLSSTPPIAMTYTVTLIIRPGSVSDDEGTRESGAPAPRWSDDHGDVSRQRHCPHPRYAPVFANCLKDVKPRFGANHLVARMTRDRREVSFLNKRNRAPDTPDPMPQKIRGVTECFGDERLSPPNGALHHPDKPEPLERNKPSSCSGLSKAKAPPGTRMDATPAMPRPAPPAARQTRPPPQPHRTPRMPSPHQTAW